MVDHVGIVVEGELVIKTDDVAIEALPKVNHYVFSGPVLILHDHLSLRQVDVEVVQTCFQMINSVRKSSFFVEKLNQRVRMQLLDE